MKPERISTERLMHEYLNLAEYYVVDEPSKCIIKLYGGNTLMGNYILPIETVQLFIELDDDLGIMEFHRLIDIQIRKEYIDEIIDDLNEQDNNTTNTNPGC